MSLKEAMSASTKGILDLIDTYPEDYRPLYRALWVSLPNQQREILEVIAKEGSIGVTNLTKSVQATQQTVSAQLSKLKKLGLVEDTKVKREVFYTLSTKRWRLVEVLVDRISSDH